MCGIVGYFGFEEDKKLLTRMNDAQAHRGPDGDGVFAEGMVGLGQRRLAIIDRARGQQPLFSPDKNLVITYNGEVYNFQELRGELTKKGYKFNTESDTEVVVQAYAEWGIKAFDMLNGMFALGLYDRKAKKLVIARDHFGIKPLYFTNIGTKTKPQLFFASEVKALLATGKVKAKPNDKIIYRYLRYRIHDESSETFFDGIYTLRPGECMTLDKDGLKIEPYTNLPQELAAAAKEQKTYTADVVQEYRDRFTKAVQMRLVSEVPVGTCLSGGMDSSAVTLTINRLFYGHDASAQAIGAVQNTFSAVFPGSINDEEKYVDAVVDTCKGDVAVYKVYPTAEEFKTDLTDFVRTQEEPTISTAQYAQFKVMQEAAKHVTVLLDGQGADEMLTGYYPYFLVYLRQLKRQKRWFKLIAEVVMSSDILLRAVRFKILDALTFKRAVNVSQLLNDRFKTKFKKETYSATPDDLRTRFIEDIFKNSLPSLLRYEDRNSMRFSLEGRVPFLDKEVTKFLFSLNEDAIILHGWNKRIVRDALKDTLPRLVHHRRNKVGFTTPEVEWFRTLGDSFKEIFESSSFAARPYFDQKSVLAEFDAFLHNRSKADSMMFWRVLNIELWLREFIDPKSDEPQKSDYDPLPGKNLDIEVKGRQYRRFPLQTGPIDTHDDIPTWVANRLAPFFASLPASKLAAMIDNPWYVFVSDRVVAAAEGRSHALWEIKPGLWARILSRFVAAPHGTGFGNPHTMQLAIQEAGLPRIFVAAVASALGKVMGQKGWFYQAAGESVRKIEVPHEYAPHPRDLMVIEPAHDDTEMAKLITDTVKNHLSDIATANFRGAVIIRPAQLPEVTGHDTAVIGDDELAEIFADNPIGDDLHTAVAVVFEKL